MHNSQPSRTRMLAVVCMVAAVAGFSVLIRHVPFVETVSAQAAQVAMFVSVLDKDGAPVKGLAANEFVVREDGARREVLRVTQPATEPIDIALLVDNTAASSRYTQDIRKAVTAFVEAMRARNMIALVTFADRPTVSVNYTQDMAQLKGGIGRLFAVEGSGSCMLDAVLEVSQGLKKRKAERAAIIVISVEGPELSNDNYLQVLAALPEGGASLNAILVNPTAAPTRPTDPERSRMIVMDRGPKESGGVRYDVLSSMALPDKLSLLATQLANQYRVVYARPDTLIPPEKFEVSVTRPGLEAHGTPVRRQSR
jgi:VWFA-related protein